MLKNKKILITTIIVLAAIIGVIFYAIQSNKDRSATSIKTTQGEIDYGNATTEDKQYNNNIKSNLPSKNDTSDKKSSDSKKIVTPVVTAWGQSNGAGDDLTVNGFVGGVIENDGICTLKLTRDSQEASVSKRALANAQDTSCGQLLVKNSDLSPGLWEAILSYDSTYSYGSSQPIIMEVK